jgi:excisionase family DNA binding protein
MPFEGTSMPAAGKAQAETVPSRVSVARRAVEGGAAPAAQPARPYRVAEVAALLDVDPTTIYRQIKAGRLRAYRIGTGRGAVRVPASALAEYQASITAAALAEVA